MSLPSHFTFPEKCALFSGSTPMMPSSNMDLPEPVGPMIERNSPLFTLRSTGPRVKPGTLIVKALTSNTYSQSPFLSAKIRIMIKRKRLTNMSQTATGLANFSPKAVNRS